jgi:hypothetical protein
LLKTNDTVVTEKRLSFATSRIVATDPFILYFNIAQSSRPV